MNAAFRSKYLKDIPNLYIILEVCVPECQVPTQYRHSRLAASRSRFRSGNIREFLKASRMKIYHFNFGARQDFPD